MMINRLRQKFLIITAAICISFLAVGLVYPQEKNVYLGTRISFRTTKDQVDFVNKHFDYVITPFLSPKVREAIRGPKLLLYRSIQGTWQGFRQFDWKHIDSCENMFLHHQGKRIKTIYHSWLMNGEDLVDPDSPDALRHWINYYAVTASKQVYSFNYDGLFIDSAGHRLSRRAVRGNLPDNYSPSRWRDARYKDLKFIKRYFPDKLVIFNGLHSDNGAEVSLDFTDGGMWETFAFKVSTGRYAGKDKWKRAIEIARKYSQRKFISIVSKRHGFTRDVGRRMFVFASYTLVSSPKVILYISDLDYGRSCILYYPEYQINLGTPQGDYFVKGDLYIRRFSEGLVLVNPDEFKSRSFILDGNYREVIPSGGGIVAEDGSWEGKVYYKRVSGRVVVPPLGGLVLKR